MLIGKTRIRKWEEEKRDEKGGWKGCNRDGRDGRSPQTHFYKKVYYRRRTARRAMSVKIL